MSESFLQNLRIGLGRLRIHVATIGSVIPVVLPQVGAVRVSSRRPVQAGKVTMPRLTVAAAAVSSYTLTGPPSGTAGSPSTSFTVTLGSGTLVGTAVITPSSGAGGGTFTPTAISLTNTSRSGTFTYTAAANGAYMISTTNNAGLTNPSGISYLVSGPSVSSYTLTGPSSGTPGSPSASFTVTLGNGSLSSPVVITPSDSSGGGAFSPATVPLTNTSRSATFTYTALSNGTYTISTTNSGSLFNPSGIIYAASAAAVSAYTLSGPQLGPVGLASSNFTVTLGAGSLAGTAVVTPSDSGPGGTFSPTSVSLTNSVRSGSFTYAASSQASLTISTSNSTGLANPSSLAYQSGTPIDSTFLTANATAYSGPPYVIGTAFGSYAAATYYYLATDITTAGAAVMIGASGVTLALNGYTITYNNATSPTVANGAFTADAPGVVSAPADWTVAGHQSSITVVSTSGSSAGPLAYPLGQTLYGTQGLQIVLPEAITGTLSFPGGSGTVAQIVSTGHGLSTNDWVSIVGGTSTPSLPGQPYQVTVIDANTFTLNGTAMTAASGTATVLKLTVLTSSNITIPTANRLYAACFSAIDQGSNSSNTHHDYINILQSGSALATLNGSQDLITIWEPYPGSTLTPNARPHQVVAVADVTSTSPLQIQAFIGNPSTSATLEVWFARALLTASHDVGIMVPGSAYSQTFAAKYNFPAAVQTVYTGISGTLSGFTLLDTPAGGGTPGSIVQGAGWGFRGHGVWCFDLNGNITIQDVGIQLNGDDTVGVAPGHKGANGHQGNLTIGGGSRGITIQYNVTQYPYQNVSVRDYFCCAINPSSYSTSQNLIQGNTIIDFPDTAILVSGINGTGGALVDSNTMYPRCVVTNQGGMYISNTVPVTISNNTVDCLSRPGGSCHSGFQLSNTTNGFSSNITINNNTFNVQDGGDRETQGQNQARAMRFRNAPDSSGSGGYSDITISGNTFLSVAPTSAYNSPAAGWITLNPVQLTATVSLGNGTTAPTNAAVITTQVLHGLSTSTTATPVAVYVLDPGTLPGTPFSFITTPNLYTTMGQLGPAYYVNVISTTAFYLCSDAGATTPVTLTGISHNSGAICKQALAEAMATPGTIQITDNVFRGITLANLGAGAYPTNALLLGITSPVGITFSGNTYDTNQIAVLLGAEGDPMSGVTMVGETFSKNTTYPGIPTGGNAPTFYTYQISQNEVQLPFFDVDIISPTYSNGATESAQLWSDTATVSWNSGWRVTATVLDSSTLLPIAGATVTLTNGSSQTDDVETTNSSGVAVLQAKVTEWTGSNSGGFNRTALGPHSISVTATGYTSSGAINLGTLAGDVSHTVDLT